MSQIYENWNEQRKTYDAIHTVVLNQPRFHRKIPSIQSCNQNTGPTTDTKRLKLVVMTSFENESLKEWSFFLELWSLELGPVVVGVALEEVEAGFNDEGGRDEESKSWGKREIAGEVEDNAGLVDDDDPLRLDYGGDLKGLPNDITPGLESSLAVSISPPSWLIFQFISFVLAKIYKLTTQTTLRPWKIESGPFCDEGEDND